MSAACGVLLQREFESSSNLSVRAGCPSKEDGYCLGVVGTGGTTATPVLPGPTSRCHQWPRPDVPRLPLPPLPPLPDVPRLPLPPLPPWLPLPDIDAVAAGGPPLQVARRGRRSSQQPTERKERAELLQPRHLFPPPLAASPVAHPKEQRQPRERSCCSQGTCWIPHTHTHTTPPFLSHMLARCLRTPHLLKRLPSTESPRTTARTELLQPRHLLDPPPSSTDLPCPALRPPPLPSATSRPPAAGSAARGQWRPLRGSSGGRPGGGR